MNDIEQPAEDWWDVLVNEEVLVSINGKFWAEKYMTALMKGSQRTWRIRPKEVTDALETLRFARPKDCGRRRR